MPSIFLVLGNYAEKQAIARKTVDPTVLLRLAESGTIFCSTDGSTNLAGYEVSDVNVLRSVWQNPRCTPEVFLCLFEKFVAWSPSFVTADNKFFFEFVNLLECSPKLTLLEKQLMIPSSIKFIELVKENLEEKSIDLMEQVLEELIQKNELIFSKNLVAPYSRKGYLWRGVLEQTSDEKIISETMLEMDNLELEEIHSFRVYVMHLTKNPNLSVSNQQVILRVVSKLDCSRAVLLESVLQNPAFSPEMKETYFKALKFV